MNLYPASGSKKLTGLIITLVALLVLVLIYIVANAIWGVSDVLFSTIGGFITTMGGGHQAGQAMVDRAQAYSPNYPSEPKIP